MADSKSANTQWKSDSKQNGQIFVSGYDVGGIQKYFYSALQIQSTFWHFHYKKAIFKRGY